MLRRLLRALAALLAATVLARPPSTVMLLTDKTAYDVGSEVRVRIAQAQPCGGAGLPSDPALTEVFVTVRYAGEQQPVAPAVAIPCSLSAGSQSPSDYSLLWKVPPEARTGRYEVDLPESHTLRIGASATP
jgi:hypothetical protein